MGMAVTRDFLTTRSDDRVACWNAVAAVWAALDQAISPLLS